MGSRLFRLDSYQRRAYLSGRDLQCGARIEGGDNPPVEWGQFQPAAEHFAWQSKAEGNKTCGIQHGSSF